MRYSVYPCSREDPSECASASKLAGALIGNPAFLKSAEYSNYTDPIKDGINTDFLYPFGIATKVKITYWFKESNIFDKTSSLFEKNEPSFSFIELEKVTSTIGTRNGATHCSPIQIEDGNCDPYLEVEIRASAAESVIERRYYTIANIVADVGGFTDVILLILGFIFEGYNAYHQAKFIKKNLYGNLIQQLQGGGASQGLDQAKGSGEGGLRGLRSRQREGAAKKLFGKKEPEGQGNGRGPQSTPNQSGEVVRADGRTGGRVLNQSLEDLRDEFDLFEFLEVSRKGSLLETIFLAKEYLKVLLPLVVFNFKRSKNLENPKKTKKNKNFVRSSQLRMMFGRNRRLVRLREGERTLKFNQSGLSQPPKRCLTGLESHLQSKLQEILGIKKTVDAPSEPLNKKIQIFGGEDQAEVEKNYF